MINKLFPVVLLPLLASCAFSWGSTKKLYEIKQVSGESRYSESEPSREGEFYRFDDINGQEYNVKANSVLYIQRVEFKK